MTRRGIAGAIARAFIDSKLTPLLIIASVLLGLVAVLVLPREEEPQIKVPMVDVVRGHAGRERQEVESASRTPMEKLLWEIPGVEYIYSHLASPASPWSSSASSRRGRRAVAGQAPSEARGQLRPHPARRRRRRSSSRARSTTCRSWR